MQIYRHLRSAPKFRQPFVLRNVHPSLRLSFSTSAPFYQESVTEQKAVEETQDVSRLDWLLRVVSKAHPPADTTLVPMRSSTLWSETLLNASSPSEQARTTSPPSPSQQLTPRSMHESYCEQVLPFGSSPQLVEKYTNASGGIQTGKLLEHLDSLAGSIAYKHLLGPGIETVGPIQERGFYVVTAAVDRLDMLARLDPIRDLRLSGQVIYTGRSSMEVAVRMEAIDGADEQTILLGRFSMVCRDAKTHKARQVNPLAINTPEEQALHSVGEDHRDRRQKLAKQDLSRVPPSSEEAKTLHDFYLKYGKKSGLTHHDSEIPPGEERVWMSDTRLESCMLMFPQERNAHSKIFGGYLMRLAYELGFTNARIFTRDTIRFLSLDKISFARPVPIGSVVRLKSYVLHSTSTPQFPAQVHVGVRANVVDVPTGKEETTNDFRFTFVRESGEPLKRKVVPRTYQGAMLWLEGKRALDMGAEIRGLRSQSESASN